MLQQNDLDCFTALSILLMSTRSTDTLLKAQHQYN